MDACPTLWPLTCVPGAGPTTPNCPAALMGPSTDGIPSALGLQLSLLCFLPSGSLSPQGTPGVEGVTLPSDFIPKGLSLRY